MGGALAGLRLPPERRLVESRFHQARRLEPTAMDHLLADVQHDQLIIIVPVRLEMHRQMNHPYTAPRRNVNGMNSRTFCILPLGIPEGEGHIPRDEYMALITRWHNAIRYSHNSGPNLNASQRRLLLSRGGAGGGSPFAHGEGDVVIDIDQSPQPTTSAQEAASATPVTTRDGPVEQVLVVIFTTAVAASATSMTNFSNGPDHLKVVTFIGLGVITVVAYAGLFAKANSKAKSKVALRLVVSAAISVMTFAVVSQLSKTWYIVTTGFAGALMTCGTLAI